MGLERIPSERERGEDREWKKQGYGRVSMGRKKEWWQGHDIRLKY